MKVNLTKKIIDSLKEQYEFRLNLGNKKMEFRKVGETKYRDLSETDFNSIRVKLSLEGTPCSKENFKTIIFSDVWEHYDPYLEFLTSLPEWDGHDYIAVLAATVRTDDDRFWVWCLRKWLVAFVGSLADEETVNQTAIIFCGRQGIGKSTWFRNILPPELKKYSSSGFLDPKDKETLVQLSELCLYNMDEVENLKPKNVEAIKELMTKVSMYLRRAYATLSQNYPRRCSFCGTANGINILHDITGNRRFLCQNVLSMDYKLKDFNLNQRMLRPISCSVPAFSIGWTKQSRKLLRSRMPASGRSLSRKNWWLLTLFPARMVMKVPRKCKPMRLFHSCNTKRTVESCRQSPLVRYFPPRTLSRRSTMVC